MHPPSPQLLCALRTSIVSSSPPSTATTHTMTSNKIRQNTARLVSRPTLSAFGFLSSSSSSSPFQKSTYTPLTIQHRNNSSTSNSRPARLIPRGHTTKPSIQTQNGNRDQTDPQPSSSSSPSSSPEERRKKEREAGGENHAQTDLASLNVLGSVPAPTTAVDACFDDGFLLDNETKVTGGKGVLLVGGEAFVWRPWGVGDNGTSTSTTTTSTAAVGDLKARIVNKKGQFDVDKSVWGLLSVVWPRPDLLIIGVGATMLPISPETKKQINSLGIRIDVQDTRNAAAQFNLLATERGVSEVAAALIPCGWKGI